MYIIPWLVMNMVLMVGLMVGVILTIVFIVIKEEEVDEMNILCEIKLILLSISLAIFTILQMINMSAVVRVFMEMKRKRRVSFSNTVEEKEIPCVNLYADSPRREVSEPGGGDSAYVTMDLDTRGTGLLFTFDSHKFD